MEGNIGEIFTISVLIPVYNAEKTINETIASVLNQSFEVLEIILVDDGSTDKSIQLVKSTFDADILNSKIKIIIQVNSGPSKARNVGVEAAKGDWIAFLDSDDIWESNKLHEQVECLNNNKEINICASASNISRLNDAKPYIIVTYKKALLKNYFATSSVLMKRNAFVELGGFKEDMRFSEDYNLWLNVLYKTNGIVITNKLLRYNLTGQNRLSNNSKEMLKGEFINYKEQFKIGRINLLEFLFLMFFARMKFFRRLFFKSQIL